MRRRLWGAVRVSMVGGEEKRDVQKAREKKATKKEREVQTDLDIR